MKARGARGKDAGSGRVGRRTGPNTYEGSIAGPGGTGTSKTTVSADGKTMTVDGVMGATASHMVFDRVK